MLGCFALTVILFYSNTLIPEIELSHHYLVSTGGHKYKLNTENLVDNFSDTEKSELFRALVEKHPNDFNNAILLKMPNDAFPLDLKFEYQGKNDIENVILNLGILSLLIYPSYLLFRFIIWAVRTLKQKE